jgi:hypothetical protein
MTGSSVQQGVDGRPSTASSAHAGHSTRMMPSWFVGTTCSMDDHCSSMAFSIAVTTGKAPLGAITRDRSSLS